jgi:hypothetical protein
MRDNNTSFCTLPWIHLATHPSGTVSPCCITDMENGVSMAKKNGQNLFLKENTLEEITNALDSNKVATGIIGLTKNLEDGEKVASRLDIPAYEDFDTWVVSVHDGNKEGKSIAYGQTAVLKNVDLSIVNAAVYLATVLTLNPKNLVAY